MGGRVCNTAEEARAVLEMIAGNMLKCGFRALDRAGSDPEDICPTPSEHRDLYNNHQKLSFHKSVYDIMLRFMKAMAVSCHRRSGNRKKKTNQTGMRTKPGRARISTLNPGRKNQGW